ncbi:MAG: SLBB domain-containing protein [Bacteroidales bacterium]|nr:SLBB domain-containing protein [Bacteroidales bacterium]
MSDSQITEFIIKAQSNNVSRAKIVTQLMERGVSIERLRQIERKFRKQEQQEVVGARNISGLDKKTSSRLRQNNTKYEEKKSSNTYFPTRKVRNSRQDETQLTTFQREQLRMQREEDFDEELRKFYPDSLDLMQEKWQKEHKNKKEEKKVFGRDIFNNKELTFEPEMNIATPADYRLGPGDAVFVDVWGASQKQYQATVSPEGAIHLEDFGPVQVSGMTVSQANKHLRSTLGSRYGGSQIRLTVGQTKTITVHVMGEVRHPGTYTLSSFATVFHALYMAGGTNEIGTMRSIKVQRGGRTVSTVDLYDYILNGNLRGNVRLASGDVITVGPYDCLVNVTGKVKRPMFYEMKSNESVSTLLKYAGGFTGDAYEEVVRLIRKKGGVMSVYTLNEFERGTFQLADADSLSVDSVLNRYSNLVELRGAVKRPGQYQMDGNISTLRQLINAAGGLSEDAMTNRGIIHRRKPNRTLSVLEFNIKALMNNEEVDQALKNEDIVFIPSQKDLHEELTLKIEGEVRYPGTYNYADSMTVESFILQAGGLTDRASLAKVDVARRYRDRKATTAGEQVAQLYSFSIKDGFVIDGQAGFLLSPFDEVFVRTSPGYVEQQHVRIEGEVNFAGVYPITKKNYRLSDLVKVAGGFTSQAYLQGARLQRLIKEEEKKKQQEIHKIATLNDSIDLEKIPIKEQSNVGINLDRALSHPNDDRWDLILQEGDRLIIPQYDNTVSISGEVMYPNTVVYKPGASLSYYIDQCGGYSLKAKKGRAFAIHKNGTVNRVRSSKTIQPGSNIVVPQREKRSPLNITALVSIASSIATLGVLMVSLLR